MDTKDDVCLKEYLMALLEERDKRIYLRIDSVEKEMHKIEKLNDEKHISMNEIRDQLKDQAKTFLLNTTYLADKVSSETRQSILDKRIDKIENLRLGGSQAWVVLVAGASVLMAFIMLVYNLFIK